MIIACNEDELTAMCFAMSAGVAASALAVRNMHRLPTEVGFIEFISPHQKYG